MQIMRLPGNSRRAKASATGQTSPAVHKCSHLGAECQRSIHLQMKGWLQMKSPQRQRGCRAESLLSGDAQADQSCSVARSAASSSLPLLAPALPCGV